VLIEQLTASHAAQRALVSQVEGLERELAQSRKREEAIKAVFFREFEKERQLFIEDKRLREKSAHLEEKSKKIQKAMKALEEKELGLEVSTAFHLGDEGFNEDPTDSDCEDDDHIAIRAPSHSYPFSYGKTALLKLNKIKNCCSIIDTKDKRFDLLRRHDYYSGWLDAMRALDHKKAIKMDVKQIRCETRDLVLNESTHYLRDLNHPQNPRNAGVNVGLLFAYSALCTQYNLSHRDRRLDVRQWDLSDLKPVAREDLFGEFAFWDGVDYAVDKMKTLFTMKIERGIWRTSDDAAQIELMRTADMKRGYDVVPGRLQVEAHPRFPLPDVRTRSSQ
jgi:regulator of replication initiation timing